MDVTANREEYLETIFKLAATAEGATVGSVARDLGVRPASASEMLRRLEAGGAVIRDPARRGRFQLTEAGRAEATRLVRRHRLSERFLTDCLEIPWDEVHAEACRLEHALSETVETRMASHLGRPLTCPHGHPIPYDDLPLPSPSVRTLADCDKGETCVVSHLSDESPEFLRYVASLGLRPGAAALVVSEDPFGGPLLVEVDGQRRSLGREAARRIFVR